MILHKCPILRKATDAYSSPSPAEEAMQATTTGIIIMQLHAGLVW
jgi:hypothetical protein